MADIEAERMKSVKTTALQQETDLQQRLSEEIPRTEREKDKDRILGKYCNLMSLCEDETLAEEALGASAWALLRPAVLQFRLDHAHALERLDAEPELLPPYPNTTPGDDS